MDREKKKIERKDSVREIERKQTLEGPPKVYEDREREEDDQRGYERGRGKVYRDGREKRERERKKG